MKQILGLSIDMDNQWSYMKTHGDKGWESFPSYYDKLVPVVIDTIKELEISITFFLVGKDLENDKNAIEAEKITNEGFSVANHSYIHEPWLHKYSYNEIYKEISKTDKLIRDVCNEKPIGFRGPGFSFSNDLFKVLLDQQYKYDCSTLPTFIGPLARLYYFKTAQMEKEERQKRNYLFGKFSEGFRKNRPHYLNVENDRKIAELPVTTFPILRSPIHLSYLIYLYRFNISLLDAYLNSAGFLLKLFNIPISFLLHPLDFLGGDKIKALEFFPGMDLPTMKKLELVKYVLNRLKDNFNITDMNDLFKNCFENKVDM